MKKSFWMNSEALLSGRQVSLKDCMSRRQIPVRIQVQEDMKAFSHPQTLVALAASILLRKKKTSELLGLRLNTFQ